MQELRRELNKLVMFVIPDLHVRGHLAEARGMSIKDIRAGLPRYRGRDRLTTIVPHDPPAFMRSNTSGEKEPVLPIWHSLLESQPSKSERARILGAEIELQQLRTQLAAEKQFWKADCNYAALAVRDASPMRTPPRLRQMPPAGMRLPRDPSHRSVVGAPHQGNATSEWSGLQHSLPPRMPPASRVPLPTQRAVHFQPMPREELKHHTSDGSGFYPASAPQHYFPPKIRSFERNPCDSEQKEYSNHVKEYPYHVQDYFNHVEEYSNHVQDYSNHVEEYSNYCKN